MTVLERQGDKITIIVHIDNGSAFRHDGHIGIEGPEVETFILLVYTIYARIPIIAVALSGHGIDRLADSPGKRNGFSEVIRLCAISSILRVVNVLLPDDDGVPCGSIRNPAGKDLRPISELLGEVVLGFS